MKMKIVYDVLDYHCHAKDIYKVKIIFQCFSVIDVIVASNKKDVYEATVTCF